MRIVCISDTHEMHRKVSIPDGDVLIHAGDFSNRGAVWVASDLNAWLGTLPHKHKILVPGNHDRCFEIIPEHARGLITNAHCLIHEELIIDGVKLFGSPWTPAFGNWAFNAKSNDHLKYLWSQIPDDTNILITHGPSNRILDKIETFESGPRYAGCHELKKRLKELRLLKSHIFGHIHEGYGSVLLNGIWRVNASVCTGRMSPRNAPIVIDI